MLVDKNRISYFDTIKTWLVVGCALILTAIFFTLILGVKETEIAVMGWTYLIIASLLTFFIWKKQLYS